MNLVISAEDLKGKAIDRKKKILINSLKKKDCTVASVLSTLVRLSKNLIDETKHSESQGTSTMKLDRNNLLEHLGSY